ncbi:hypothetical protein HBH82_086780 [Parastagonospora nodorum]|nr:hypothetical protein HBH82_086780 [Parastagonospora nodorum]KAH4696621.1 hypothetical protein HBH78_064690 [Parastagonospora nodorum]KAH4709470.1 hypothetical protein HBH67_050770 [Parastagonospora nodorum]KAH4783083.1 hypothetical protein HBH62_106800 [Parastagonospora nodorum]KAH4802441.1 hypothetical protein HBH63_068080 [Parastagonospora nodorum]
MVDFVPYSSNMHNDFELYSNNQEQHMDYPITNQPFLPTSTYSMEQSFNATFDPMMHLTEGQRPHDLQYHYDAIAQGVKPIQYQTPAGSPHSTTHSFHEQPPVLSASSESGASVSSSALGSPTHYTDSWNSIGLGLTSSFDYPGMTASDKNFVDPNVLQPFAFAPQSPFHDMQAMPSPYFPVIEHPPSPALSHISSQSLQPGSARIKQGSASPYLRTQQYHPYQHFNGQRRGSVTSIHSKHSGSSRKSRSSFEVDDEPREKGLCPLPECGRVFKDLKAHMLTHKSERPEKCPIATCEYYVKGFARKYDKNRHTLTHYKGTMVCGFCPGSGSAAEKSFNRADVFKRHLTSVHGVEQNPPNSRKRSPGGRKPYTGNANVAGTCSTCSVTFANAQEFYEHLDDCVLRVVQQADPSEAINQRLLTSVAEDRAVTETLDRNGLSKSIEYTVPSYNENDDDDVISEEEFDNDDHNDDTYGSRRNRSGKGSLKSSKQH